MAQAFSSDVLKEIRSRITVSDIVGKKVKLTLKGNEHQGLCPFHNEKTPSFTVNDNKGFYHCFGCGAHGDVIRFVMEAEKLSFDESVRQLASKVNFVIPIPEFYEEWLVLPILQLHEFSYLFAGLKPSDDFPVDGYYHEVLDRSTAVGKAYFKLGRCLRGDGVERFDYEYEESPSGWLDLCDKYRLPVNTELRAIANKLLVNSRKENQDVNLRDSTSSSTTTKVPEKIFLARKQRENQLMTFIEAIYMEIMFSTKDFPSAESVSSEIKRLFRLSNGIVQQNGFKILNILKDGAIEWESSHFTPQTMTRKRFNNYITELKKGYTEQFISHFSPE